MFTKIYEKIKKFIKENYKTIIALILIYLLFTIELPYSVYTPGGAVNLNNRISVKDGYSADGSFNMAYVSMVRGSIPFLLMAKIIPNWDIVKKEDLTIPGENIDEMMDRERLYLKESQDAAVINAYKMANKDINITKVNNNIGYITKEAKTNLQVGDIILKVNNEEINSLTDLQDLINTFDVNEKVNVLVKRDNKEKECYATTYEVEEDIKIGVSLITTYEYSAKPEVTLKAKASEMGSSGGLMMSLTIYNQLVANDITKGKKIVGTGTIDIDGNVGEIGGVKYKLIGAVKKGADIFMCPYENYEEALEVAKEHDFDIKIIYAKTFTEALEKLANI